MNLENLNIDVENISEDEWKIIKNLISYPYLLYQSTLSNEPHRLTNYLENICAQFHSIWNKGKENQSLRFIDEQNILNIAYAMEEKINFKNKITDWWIK